MLNRVIQDIGILFGDIITDLDNLGTEYPVQQTESYRERLSRILGNIHLLIEDTSQKKQELEELNNKLQKAYAVIQISDVVVMEWTLEVDIPTAFVTDNISKYGYTAEDFYTGEMKDYWNFIHPEDRDTVRERVHAKRKEKIGEFRHQYRVLCQDGSVRWVEENAIWQYDSNDRPIRERGILYDITDQVVMNERLRGSEERYRTLFDRAPAIMITMDAGGHITSANRYCQEFFHYSEEDLKRKRFQDLISGRTDEKERFKDIHGLVKLLKGLPVELEVRTREMRTRNIQMTLDSVEYANAPIEIQAIAQDVTKKKAIEEKVRYLSYHDKLTGLYNRAWFDEQLKAMEMDGQLPYTVIIGDMNGLKVANDLFGHKTGDTLLVVTAEILRKCCRESDVICRQGGDEFAILLPNAGEDAAREVCHRIRTACEETRMKPLGPSIALGYSTRVDVHTSIEDVMKDADDRMYRNKLNVSNSLRSSLVLSLQASLEEKTLETKEHAERIRSASLELGKRLGLSESLLDELSLASMMHDIGKIGVPDSVLTKPGKLNAEEWEIMKKHCEIGRNILNTSTNMQSVGDYILHHHERWDGTGYPHGLEGEAIPLISRIISVVDSYDVMIFNRVYSHPKTPEEACAELVRCRGTQFDPRVVDAFLQGLKEPSGPEGQECVG